MSVRPPVRAAARPLVVAVLAFAASACQDALTAPLAPPGTPASAAPSGQVLACTVDVRAHTLGCAPALPAASASAAGPRRAVIFGGQGLYVRLTSTATGYSGDTLTVPVSVQNLLAQPMGTSDGVSYDGLGVAVFFAQAPTTTGGSGAVTVLNADTTDTYTAAGQPAFVYPQYLAGNQTSAPRDWLFAVPTTVTAFQFLVYVRAQLPDEAQSVGGQPAHAFSTDAAGIVGGVQHTCALRPGAGVYCWGQTTVPGLAGSMAAANSAVPLLVPGSAKAVALASSVASSHACWLAGAGAAACVGDNSFGQLGDGTTTASATPRDVGMPDGVAGFTQLIAGVEHTCGLTSAGAAYCWGFNGFGQLGDGTQDDASSPVAVRLPGAVRFAALGAGELHGCGLTAGGDAYCWGFNEFGQLGDGTTADAATPVRVRLPAGVALTSIAGGAKFTCGLAADGAAYCWGDNTDGQLGDGTGTSRGAPGRVALPGAVRLTQLVAGIDHACGRAVDGSVYCWGGGSNGQIGDGQFGAQLAPVAVPLPGVTAARLSAGGVHTCAITPAGAAYCWGWNSYGQIGDGTSGPGADRGTPAVVRMP